jgi:histone-lysine N-methyltransferase SETMAR
VESPQFLLESLSSARPVYVVDVYKLPLQMAPKAHPHTTKKIQKIEELEGTELLTHPAFSPDFEPSDYYLFRSMAQLLRGKKFQSVADMQVAVEEFFASKDKEWFY